MKDQSKQYLLVHLMSKCSDFTKQRSDIEELVSEVSCAHNYNSDILFTPKFHCKLAGEGIENSWWGEQEDILESVYPLKNSVTKFEKLVVNCLS